MADRLFPADLAHSSAEPPVPLLAASEAGDGARVRELLDSGADVNLRHQDGWSAAIMASKEGSMPASLTTIGLPNHRMAAVYQRVCCCFLFPLSSHVMFHSHRRLLQSPAGSSQATQSCFSKLSQLAPYLTLRITATQQSAVLPSTVQP